MTTGQLDRIEKDVVLRAPRGRVWKALANVEEFNQWFGVNLQGEFAPGAKLSGRIRHKGYEHLTMAITIERFEPEHTLAWRWHPGAEGGEVAKSEEETTHVVFTLDEVPEGTRLRVVETGFDRVPVSRRERVFRENEGGWTGQMKAIKKYVEEAK
jgi:uncharacterized protein YndB with AHSA1/START domain